MLSEAALQNQQPHLSPRVPEANPSDAFVSITLSLFLKRSPWFIQIWAIEGLKSKIWLLRDCYLSFAFKCQVQFQSCMRVIQIVHGISKRNFDDISSKAKFRILIAPKPKFQSKKLDSVSNFRFNSLIFSASICIQQSSEKNL